MRSRSVVPDLMQMIYVRLHTHFEEICRLENSSGWLMKVAINICNDELRRSMRQQIVCEKMFHYELRRHRQLDRQSFQEYEVGEILDTLPPKIGTLVELHYIQGFSIGELSKISGVARSTMAKRLETSLGKMRKNALETTIES